MNINMSKHAAVAAGLFGLVLAVSSAPAQAQRKSAQDQRKEQVAQIPAHSQQAAFLLSAGAWAVGHADRLKALTDAQRLRAIAEASFGSIPIDSRKAIEPAISFAFWFIGSLLDGYYASAYGAAERDERDAQLRGLYRTFVQAALASYRAGLAFEDHRPEKVG